MALRLRSVAARLLLNDASRSALSAALADHRLRPSWSAGVAADQCGVHDADTRVLTDWLTLQSDVERIRERARRRVCQPAAEERLLAPLHAALDAAPAHATVLVVGGTGRLANAAARHTNVARVLMLVDDDNVASVARVTDAACITVVATLALDAAFDVLVLAALFSDVSGTSLAPLRLHELGAARLRAATVVPRELAVRCALARQQRIDDVRGVELDLAPYRNLAAPCAQPLSAHCTAAHFTAVTAECVVRLAWCSVLEARTHTLDFAAPPDTLVDAALWSLLLDDTPLQSFSQALLAVSLVVVVVFHMCSLASAARATRSRCAWR